MFHTALCPTCGHPLGDVAMAFNAWRKKMYDEKLEKEGILQENAYFTNVDVDLLTIFRELHIDYPCCRMHISTTLNFLEVYHS